MDSSRCSTLKLLFLLSLIDLVRSLNCKPTQYSWPSGNPHLCCDMCPPGKSMESRDKKTCENECLPCTGERYTDSYNIGSCKICNDCNKENMELVSRCNGTHNAVCRCKAGFECEDKACNDCTEILTTIAPPTSTHKTTDAAWFLIIIGLLCVGIALVIVTKIKPLLNWFTHKKSYCLVRKPVPVSVPVYIEEEGDEEEPCPPIQEMCGK